MIASLVGDALMGLGCVTFGFAMMAGAALLLALRVGQRPGLKEYLTQLWRNPPPKESGERTT
jgi:hypothetical protein